MLINALTAFGNPGVGAISGCCHLSNLAGFSSYETYESIIDKMKQMLHKRHSGPSLRAEIGRRNLGDETAAR
jgi:hypothetical protein